MKNRRQLLSAEENKLMLSEYRPDGPKKINQEKKLKATTNQLTKSAISMLSFAGFKVWRQNNAAVFDPTVQQFRSNSSVPGIPDIIGFHRKSGRFIAVEVKNVGDRLTTEQSNFLKILRESGGLALIVTDMDDIENIKNFRDV